MDAHIVLAHPESKSFNGHLFDVTRSSLEQLGEAIPYPTSMPWDSALASDIEHYAEPLDGERFSVQNEQRHASNRRHVLPFDVKSRSIELLVRAISCGACSAAMPQHVATGNIERMVRLTYSFTVTVYTSKRRFDARAVPRQDAPCTE